MTLGTLRTHVGEKFGMDYANAGTEQTLLTDWANEGVLQYLADTGLHAVTSTIAVTAGVGDYALPFQTGSIIIHQMWATDVSSLNAPLEPISPNEMIVLRRSVGSDTVRYYAIQGDLLMLYPTPTANGNIQMIHTPIPTALANAGDDLATLSLGGIPARFQIAVEYWMSWRAGSHTKDSGSGNGQMYLQLYEQQVGKDRGRQRRASGKRLAPAKVGPPSWRGLNILPNSQDITHR